MRAAHQKVRAKMTVQASQAALCPPCSEASEHLLFSSPPYKPDSKKDVSTFK